MAVKVALFHFDKRIGDVYVDGNDLYASDADAKSIVEDVIQRRSEMDPPEGDLAAWLEKHMNGALHAVVEEEGSVPEDAIKVSTDGQPFV